MTMETRENILNNGFDKAEHNNIKYIDTMWIACILMALIATISICYSIWLVSDVDAYKRRINELDSSRLELKAQIVMFNDSLANEK